LSANVVNPVRFRLTSTAPRLPRLPRLSGLATAKLSNCQRAEPPRESFRLRASGGRIIHAGPGKTGVWRPQLSISAFINPCTQRPCNYFQENVCVGCLCRVANWYLLPLVGIADTHCSC